MTFRSIALMSAAVALTAVTVPTSAQAFFFWGQRTYASVATWGQATTAVNLRTCGSTACQRILVVPPGGQVQITGTAGNWYQVNYGGHSGFMSARYVASASSTPAYTTYGSTGTYPRYSTYGYTGYGSNYPRSYGLFGRPRLFW
jgi:uncharacterized protein YraI